MYCHQCGTKAHGNFCSNCGTRLIAPEPAPANGPDIPPPPLADWSHELRYDILLLQPEVRQRIAENASRSQKKMTGEQFLALSDKALQPIIGVSLETVTSIAIPLYSALGIQTGKNQKTTFTAPPGKTIVACLCALARRGQELDKVEQGEDGCVLKATIPSDVFSFSGELLITIQHHAPRTTVEAGTIIKGQLYDWGKSKRILEKFFQDIQANLAG